MVKGGIGKIAKFLLVTVTFLLAIAGIAVFSIGIWATKSKVSAVENLLSSQTYTSVTYVFIGAGLVIAFFSYLGCCGALREDKLKLAFYFIVLLVIFIILLVGGSLGFVFKAKVEKNLLKALNSTVPDYGKKDHVTNGWDIIQHYFNCCGVSIGDQDSYRIWEGNEYLEKKDQPVPPSCCENLEEVELCMKDPKNNVNEKDCYVEVKKYALKNAKIIGAVGLGIALFLIVGMLLTCCLYRRIGKKY